MRRRGQVVLGALYWYSALCYLCSTLCLQNLCTSTTDCCIGVGLSDVGMLQLCCCFHGAAGLAFHGAAGRALSPLLGCFACTSGRGAHRGEDKVAEKKYRQFDWTRRA